MRCGVTPPGYFTPPAPASSRETSRRSIERCAPGFRDRIVGRNAVSAAAMEQHPNYVAEQISAGLWIHSNTQLLFRLGFIFSTPSAPASYSTPAPGIFVCSSSTPPGGGVHGMCGYWAARSVLSRVFDKPAPKLNA